MSRIFWDTNLFICLFEDYGTHSERVAQLRRRMLERGDELVTSTLTVAEVLTGPLRSGNEILSQQYEEAMRAAAVVVSFDPATARLCARLRAKPPKISSPDAIQLACAASAGVDLFLTNDVRLHALHIDGIHFITSVDRAPL
ncbi:MAG TPA: PIN domain-containing protein [Acidobacteriaceae bacterium]|nr:PIN domain-containing protein [Acidobacteriaceae bacterium]